MTAKTKYYADGTTELWWECFKHHRVSASTERPKTMQEGFARIDALAMNLAAYIFSKR